MAEAFLVTGGQRLSGSIAPSGNKNEALPCLAAALLTSAEVVLQNVPDILDVRTMLALAELLGAEVQRPDPHTVVIRAADLTSTALDRELSSRIRGSFLFAAPLLARRGEVALPRPGGDRIGRRRVDTHLLALAGLGAELGDGDPLQITAPNGLRGTELFLDEASVTGTEQAIMAAVLAPGRTVILNAASEPHVRGLCQMLCAMGAQISGVGSNILSIDGVGELRGTTHRIGPDLLEVGSFIGLAAATRSELRITAAGTADLAMVRIALRRLGVEFVIHGDDVLVPGHQELQIREEFDGAIPKIDDAPWPGFPADLISIALVVATQCQGMVMVHEKMYESRLFFVDRLIDMGAKIVLCDPHRAVVAGPSRLHGAQISSPDIRAGMALLIAALAAQGESRIFNVQQIDRGYERIDARLRSLGAQLARVEA
ncbi:MAG: UDP-N-acetylglucosamine 1-carboxyvinyltransferase [Fimbriimonadaceae bacterium]|nr:UDP-N-acetylglucosamine 1-carboxyvinyltransferase [Fimbriimonadaceae bacterium]